MKALAIDHVPLDRLDLGIRLNSAAAISVPRAQRPSAKVRLPSAARPRPRSKVRITLSAIMASTLSAVARSLVVIRSFSMLEISGENRAESREEILREYLAYSAKRRESQPLNMPSAGSTFKRPANGFASRLIDEAGLKGFRIGDAEVSTKHAGFVVNRGGATAEDVLKVIEAVRKTVFEKTGVTLDPEIVYLE